MDTFGNRLKSLRREAGLTQAQFSEKVGVHLQTVSKWERGVSEPDFSVLGEIAAALGISLETLLGAPEGENTYTGNFDIVVFGEVLAELRRRRGESQEKLAEWAGVSAATVSKWECGVICPDAELLLRLAEHFGIPVSGLYFGISDKKSVAEAPTGDPSDERGAAGRARVRPGIQKSGRLFWAGALGLFGAGLICFSVFLPKIFTDDGGRVEAKAYTVTVEGKEYEVGADDWFVPETPSRDGYDFIGFADEKGEPVTFPKKISGDCHYVALFVPHKYEIDYWLNGGMLTSAAEYTFTVESGTLSLPAVRKAGAEFKGWYLSPDYSGEAVDGIVCTGEDVDLYARWSEEVYTVRYDLNGGTISEENPETVTAAEEILLAEPVRKGCHFLGWQTSDGEIVQTVGGRYAKNEELTALWQESGDLLTVLYHPNGGTPEGENPVSVGAGEVHTLSGAKKTGYDFVGWNTAADGSGEYVEKLYGIREDLELYAIYTPKVYVVRYELNGGTFYEGTNPNEIEYGTEVTLRPVAREGHTFVGWYDSENGGTRVEVIDKNNLLRLTALYARFERNEYTVVLDGCGGTFDMGGEQVSDYELRLYYGDEYALPDCTLAGYDFLGWYDEEGIKTEEIAAENIGDMRLTAEYRPAGLTYVIEYRLNGGEMTEDNPKEVGWGQEIELASPEREGYLFLGWNDRADGSGEYYETTPADGESDLTLYAIWQEIVESGSADDFTYEAGRESVTITGYTGQFGENVDLVIPSYIDGKPVVAVDGSIHRSPESHNPVSLRAVNIPDTVKKLGAKAFTLLTVSEPLTIPASVEEIGAHCFSGTTCRLYFEEGNRMPAIGEYAFAGARFRNVIVLPKKIERLEANAFSGATLWGIVLPESLVYISGRALSCWCGSSLDLFEVYIPSSVKYIEPGAFDGAGKEIIYVSSEEQTKTFSEGWAESRYSPSEVVITENAASGITLKDGNASYYLEGEGAFALPEPEKEGYTFLGWYSEETDFVWQYFIAPRDGLVLEAVYEEKSASDGRSRATPAVIEFGEDYEFLLLPTWEVPAWDNSEGFWFSMKGTGRVLITLEYTPLIHGVEECFSLNMYGPTGTSVGMNAAVSYNQGDVFRIVQGIGDRYGCRIKLKIELMPQ